MSDERMKPPGVSIGALPGVLPGAMPAGFLAVLVACILALGACGGGEDTGDHSAANADASVASELVAESDDGVTDSNKKSYMVFADYMSETDSLPRLRFRDDGQVSLNDRCAVRQVKLNPKMQPAYVNGRPVGFC